MFRSLVLAGTISLNVCSVVAYKFLAETTKKHGQCVKLGSDLPFEFGR